MAPTLGMPLKQKSCKQTNKAISKDRRRRGPFMSTFPLINKDHFTPIVLERVSSQSKQTNIYIYELPKM